MLVGARTSTVPETAGTATQILDAAERLVQQRGFNSFSYADVFRDDRMCLCGMLAADYATLPEPMRARVVRFFDDNEGWLARVLEEGRTSGSVRFRGSARAVARTLIGGLEGAMLVSRPYRDVKRFRDAAELLIRGLAVERSP